ncbi:MAG: HPr kinase/phosphatase C-terminal domain-containing protein [Blastomonas sp.]
MTGGPSLQTLFAASAIAIGDRAMLITGPSGIGKSELTLALVDRGANLIGDDQVMLTRDEISNSGTLLASPAPNIEGQLEVRNLGILPCPSRRDVPVALVLALDPDAPRWIDKAGQIELLGMAIPMIRLTPNGTVLPIKAEWALQHYGQKF